jgi:hypothetical protein
VGGWGFVRSVMVRFLGVFACRNVKRSGMTGAQKCREANCSRAQALQWNGKTRGIRISELQLMSLKWYRRALVPFSTG